MGRRRKKPPTRRGCARDASSTETCTNSPKESAKQHKDERVPKDNDKYSKDKQSKEAIEDWSAKDVSSQPELNNKIARQYLEKAKTQNAEVAFDLVKHAFAVGPTDSLVIEALFLQVKESKQQECAALLYRALTRPVLKLDQITDSDKLFLLSLLIGYEGKYDQSEHLASVLVESSSSPVYLAIHAAFLYLTATIEKREGTVIEASMTKGNMCNSIKKLNQAVTHMQKVLKENPTPSSLRFTEHLLKVRGANIDEIAKIILPHVDFCKRNPEDYRYGFFYSTPGPEKAAFAKSILQRSPDSWEAWMAYLESAPEVFLEQANEYVKLLVGHKKRGPLLAILEYCYIDDLLPKEEAWLELWNCCGDSPSYFSSVRRYADLYKYMVAKFEVNLSDLSESTVTRLVNLLMLQKHLDLPRTDANLIKIYYEARAKMSKASQELQTTSAYDRLAHFIVLEKISEIFTREYSSEELLGVVCFLEDAVAHNPCATVLQYDLLQVLMQLGCTDRAMQVFRAMQIRNIQLDTLGHLVVGYLGRQGRFDLLESFTDEFLEFRRATLINTSNGIYAALCDRKYHMVPQFRRLHERIKNSLTYKVAFAERWRWSPFRNPGEIDDQTMRELLKTYFDSIDNRDTLDFWLQNHPEACVSRNQNWDMSRYIYIFLATQGDTAIEIKDCESLGPSFPLIALVAGTITSSCDDQKLEIVEKYIEDAYKEILLDAKLGRTDLVASSQTQYLEIARLVLAVSKVQSGLDWLPIFQKIKSQLKTLNSSYLNWFSELESHWKVEILEEKGLEELSSFFAGYSLPDSGSLKKAASRLAAHVHDNWRLGARSVAGMLQLVNLLVDESITNLDAQKL